MPYSRRRGDSARRHADTIRGALMEARPAGLLFGQLLRATELSPGQARTGLAMLRDQISSQGWPPLVWSR